MTVVLGLLAVVLAACAAAPQVTQPSATPPAKSSGSRSPAAGTSQPGLQKIKHVIIIVQENRSFDSYFGTYPGADGIPRRDGVPAVCVPDPAGGCVRP